MTFQEFHDAIKALCPPGGTFSAGMTAWSHDGGARRNVGYSASVHVAVPERRMVAHCSELPSPEAAIAAMRGQLDPATPDYAQAVASATEPV